jgi:hypothetical protein
MEPMTWSKIVLLGAGKQLIFVQKNDESAEHSASEFTLSYFESCHQNLVIFSLLNFLPMFLPLQQHAACQKSLETPSSFLHEQDYPLANLPHHPNQTYDQNHCQSLSC